MASMPLVCSSAPIGQVTDTQRIPARKYLCHGLGHPFDRLYQGRRSVARFLSGTQSFIALSSIGKWDRLVKISFIRCADRDRLAHGERLAHTRTNRRDR